MLPEIARHKRDRARRALAADVERAVVLRQRRRDRCASIELAAWIVLYAAVTAVVLKADRAVYHPVGAL